MTGALFFSAWVVLGLIVFFVAMSGGARGARGRLQTQRPRGRLVVRSVLGLIVLVGIVVPAAILLGESESKSAGVGDLELTADAKRGRELFVRGCGNCHQLALAGTVGRTGPSLDVVAAPGPVVASDDEQGPDRAPTREDCATLERDSEDANVPNTARQFCFVLRTIQRGKVAGIGTMPANIFTGEDADRVAAYVAEVAGRK